MSSPLRRSLQTRGRNRPARNALHPPRGARSAVACRALSGAPAPFRARQSGLPQGPRAGRDGSGTLPRVAQAGQRGRLLAPPPASPTRRPPPPLASPPDVRDRVPRRRRRPHGRPLAQRRPRSTTLRVGALVLLSQVHGVPREPRRLSTAPEPTVSVPRPSCPVGDPLSVLGRGGRCQNRHGSLQVGALFVLFQAHGVPGMARVSSGETPWPRSFGLKLPDR